MHVIKYGCCTSRSYRVTVILECINCVHFNSKNIKVGSGMWDVIGILIRKIFAHPKLYFVVTLFFNFTIEFMSKIFNWLRIVKLEPNFGEYHKSTINSISNFVLTSEK